jgi:hypothetical protein
VEMVQKPPRSVLETALAAGLLVTLVHAALAAELVSGNDLCYAQLVEIRTAQVRSPIPWKLAMVILGASGRYLSGAHVARIVDMEFKSAQYPASLG